MSDPLPSRQKKDILRNYYSKCDLYLPPNSRWRQFRLFIDGGEPLKYVFRDTISLRQALLKFLPNHVYYTTSLWQSPLTLGPLDLSKAKRAGYQIAYTLFLGQDLVFDVDFEGDFDRAKAETIKLIRFLKEDFEFKNFTQSFSGYKGFHVKVYDNYVDGFWASPKQRLIEYQDRRVDIVNAVYDAGIEIDAETTVDAMRIIRLEKTVNCKSMKVCDFVPDIQQFSCPESIEKLCDDKTLPYSEDSGELGIQLGESQLPQGVA